jgi:uncharacterized protein (TIGR02246 family)
MITRAMLFLAMSMQPDDNQIIELHQQFAALWSRGDATAAAALFSEDAVRVGAAGDIQHGRAEIAAALDRLVNGRFKGATVKVEPGQVRKLGDEFAIWQAPMEIHPPKDSPPIKGYVIDVMKKHGGRWEILETHPKLFPPPPPR